jgi:hypothetical protein
MDDFGKRQCWMMVALAALFVVIVYILREI